MPIRFTIGVSFSDDEDAHLGDRSTVRTAALDALFSALKSTTDGMCDSLALLQRPDGATLLEGVVKPHTISPEVDMFLKSPGNGTIRGAWRDATAYGIKDLVTVAGKSYACLVAHTSASLFATDLDAGYWGPVLQSSRRIASEFGVTPGGSLVSTNVQAALSEVRGASLAKELNLHDLADKSVARGNLRIQQSLQLAVSSETDQITTGPAKVTFRAPHSFRVDSIRASLSTAGTTPTTIDVNRNGVSMFGTNKLTIDAGAKSSVSAAAQGTIITTGLHFDDEITVDIDTAGSGAKGLKVLLVYRRTDVQPDPSVEPAEEPVFAPPPPPPGLLIFTPAGFGKNATGGLGKPVFHVTNLNSSGTGSLRDACSQGNRHIVFDVAGTINNSSRLLPRGPNVTIDGLTAPSPGITITGRAVILDASANANNMIIRGLRHRDSSDGEDGFAAFGGAHTILFDRLSIARPGDGGLDITEGCRDITYMLCIIGPGSKNSLLGHVRAHRISVLYNLFFEGHDRNPKASWRIGEIAPSIVADVRNNLVWRYGFRAFFGSEGTKANVVNNFYYGTGSPSASNTIMHDEASVIYASGNYSLNGLNLSGRGNTSTPHAAVLPETTYDAITAAYIARDHAGCRGGPNNIPLDATDQAIIDSVVGLPPLPR